MRRSKGTVASAASELDHICTLASPDIDEATLSKIRQLIDITSERSEIDPTWCVIGMLGGTGAGKSSLVNALSGGEVVTAGVRRRTSRALFFPSVVRRRNCSGGWELPGGWRLPALCLETRLLSICPILIRSRPGMRISRSASPCALMRSWLS